VSQGLISETEEIYIFPSLIILVKLYCLIIVLHTTVCTWCFHDGLLKEHEDNCQMALLIQTMWLKGPFLFFHNCWNIKSV